MKSNRSSGCLGCLLIPCALLALLLGWGYLKGLPRSWTFSRWRWTVASDTTRLTMARNYLATRSVRYMTLGEVVADLGEPTEIEDYWSYVLSPRGLGVASDYAMPSHRDEPILYAKFSRKGVLECFDSSQLWEPTSAVAFDAGVWKSLSAAERGAMAYDLFERGRLRGASKEQVRQELGEPDLGEMKLEYLVGYGGSDPVFLEFWLDSSGLVVRACAP